MHRDANTEDSTSKRSDDRRRNVFLCQLTWLMRFAGVGGRMIGRCMIGGCVIGGCVIGGLAAAGRAETVRFATFNTSLNRCLNGNSNPCLAGGLEDILANPNFPPARQVAETIQRIAPDVILLNEFNYDEAAAAIRLFQENYLAVAQNISNSPMPATPIHYPYVYAAPSNTGIASGFDLNNDGQVGSEVGDGVYGNDAFGFGEFPGRYGMVLLSKFPIDTPNVRTFQRFLWRDMPGALLPDDPSTPAANDWYTADELAAVRLSSKSHWDVPIQINGQLVHVLASHPTPPVFDGAEDRNGRRNHDEIRLWADYLTPGAGDYLVDDQNRTGGLAADAKFVVLGDLNADPDRGDSWPGAIQQLLEHPRINSRVVPETFGGSTDTATFNLRVDYVLPSNNLLLKATEVFEPAPRDPLRRLMGASDHRLVWADLEIAEVPEPTGGGAVLAAIGALWGVVRRRTAARLSV